MANEMQNSVLLLKSCRTVELIVRWCHEQVDHARRSMTMNQIRSPGSCVRRWKSLVRCIILKCVSCKQFKRKASATKNGRFAQGENE